VRSLASALQVADLVSNRCDSVHRIPTAQAKVEGLALMTKESAIEPYDVGMSQMPAV